MDIRELRNKTGGLFGAGEQTGSIGVVTINMPRLGYLAKTEKEFFSRLGALMDLAKESLEIKRKLVQKHLDGDLLPYTKTYLGTLKNHFSTIGLVGLNECCLNFLGCSIFDKDGVDFSLRVLDFMRNRISEYQAQTGHIYNLEATPAEGTSFRLARIDRKKYPDIICAGDSEPYYTNTRSFRRLHNDLFEASTFRSRSSPNTPEARSSMASSANASAIPSRSPPSSRRWPKATGYPISP
jgi:ribonucleoside-triphosphate reductase